MQRIPELIARIEQGGDVREEARTLVTELLAFHREGLVRLTKGLPEAALADAARDPLVASLLDLHAIPVAPPAPLVPATALVRRQERGHAGRAACELCGEEATARHPHLVDVGTDAVLCACLACALRFPTNGENGAPYARIPDGVRQVETLRSDDAWWQALGVPAGLAMFVPRRAAPPRVLYPGAAGAMEASVAPETWAAVVRAHPVLGTITPHVEALLVDRVEGAREHWICGVDRCYELVAVIRERWRGFTGGEEARDARRRFFAALREGEEAS